MMMAPALYNWIVFFLLILLWLLVLCSSNSKFVWLLLYSLSSHSTYPTVPLITIIKPEFHLASSLHTKELSPVGPKWFKSNFNFLSLKEHQGGFSSWPNEILLKHSSSTLHFSRAFYPLNSTLPPLSLLLFCLTLLPLLSQLRIMEIDLALLASPPYPPTVSAAFSFLISITKDP